MAPANLPENDTDLRLARAYGLFLEEQTAHPARNSTLLSHLQRYKEDRNERSSSVSVDSEALWSRIEAQTAPAPSAESTRIIPFRSATSRAVAAAAAIILLAGLLGVFFYLNTQPQLVAQTQAQMEIVTLADGSSVTLRPYSVLHKFSGDKRAYALSGEAFFQVTPDIQRPFTVQAENGTVEVLGTRFNLSTWGRKTQLFLEEGSVRFQSLISDTSVILTPGQSAIIGADDRLAVPDSANAAEFTDWMNSELVFRNRTAGYVFNELEQHFGIRIEASRPVVTIRVGGRLSLSNKNRSLEDLGIVLGGRFEQTSGKTYRFIPR